MSESVKEEIARIAQARGHRVEEDVRFDWMTNRVPTEPDSDLAPQVKYRLIALHRHLGGEWDTLPKKRMQYLRFDLFVDDRVLIEVDNFFHFSSARLETLKYYSDLPHHLDLELYKRLCQEHREEADRYHQRRQAAGFAFEGGRTAQRAYFDAAKDLVSQSYGYRLLRLPAPQGELSPEATLALRVFL